MGPESPDDDARLMLEFQAGDAAGFERLFQRYSGPLVAFLGRMVPDRGRAEELAQGLCHSWVRPLFGQHR